MTPQRLTSKHAFDEWWAERVASFPPESIPLLDQWRAFSLELWLAARQHAYKQAEVLLVMKAGWLREQAKIADQEARVWDCDDRRCEARLLDQQIENLRQLAAQEKEDAPCTDASS